MGNPGLLEVLPGIPAQLPPPPHPPAQSAAAPARIRDRRAGRLACGQCACAAREACNPKGFPRSDGQACPSLEGGLEEWRGRRPIRSRRLASSVAKAVSWVRSCSFSCLRTWISCCWDQFSALMPAAVACQSASDIPTGGVVIATDLSLRCKRDPSRGQRFCRANVRSENPAP